MAYKTQSKSRNCSAVSDKGIGASSDRPSWFPSITGRLNMSPKADGSRSK